MTTPRICATIEARMASTRLPGKVLMPSMGRPMLELMIERVRRVPSIDDVIVATTVNASDDPVAALAARLGVRCFRGSEEDVMSRVLGAASANDVDVIVELTGDCPLIDPLIVEEVISAWRATGVDYCSNILTRSFPIGMDTQVFPTRVLADAFARTDAPDDREHVSLYIYRNPRLYSLHGVEAPPSRHDPELRLTLDTPEDFKVIDTIFSHLYPSNPAFGLDDVLAFLRDRPDIRAVNNHVAHRWV